MSHELSSETERQALLDARRRYSVSRLSSRQTRPVKPVLAGNLPPQRPPRRRGIFRPWIRRVLLVLVLAALTIGGVFGYRVIAASDSISAADRSIFGQLKDLLFLNNSLLKGESQDRINILLIAIGGKGHKGEDLADAIMVISHQPSNNKTALLSIPRDLYVQLPDREYFSKINAVHSFGESQKQNQGPELLRDLVQDITSLPIHYYIRVDFTAFKNIIDDVGGINLTIDNSFYDYWHKISFPAGTEKMNGERALAYVRARYIDGSEGGDFKRAARQQQVLLSLRDKVFSVQTALDFTKINALLSSLSGNMRTDMQLWEMKRFYELARLVDQSQIQSVVLSTGPKGILTGGTEVLGGVPASVLRPRTGDYSEIQKLARNILAVPIDDVAPPVAAETILPAPTEIPDPSPSATPALPSLSIRNGTAITGLAGRTAEILKRQGYIITDVANAAERGQAQTYVYAISPDHTASAAALAETLGAKLANGLPENETQTAAEILVILGIDSDDTGE